MDELGEMPNPNITTPIDTGWSLKKKVALFVGLFSIFGSLSFLLLSGLMNPATTPISAVESQAVSSSGLAEQTGFRGDVWIYFTPKGSTEEILVSHKSNMIVTLGMSTIRSYLFDTVATYTPIKAIGIAQLNTSQAITDVTLQGEWTGCGGARATGTYGSVAGTSNQAWLNNTFTFSCDGINVNATALYNATSGSFMFAQQNFTLVPANNGDTLKVAWNVTHTS